MIRYRHKIRRGFLALVAVLAMLVQAVSAPAAMAAPESGQAISVCTAHGLQTLIVNRDHNQPAPAHCPHCDQCMAPALAALPNVVRVTEPVRYAAYLAVEPLAVALSPYAARAPPRPPSRAPPSVLNV